MLDIVIYYFVDVNVFVMGVIKNNLFVVVSIGLLDNMIEDEVEVVVVYEIVYIMNGDMVIMILL